MTEAKREEQIEREAAEWFTLLHSGEADAEIRSAFETWLHGSRAHKIAYREFEQVFRDLEFVAPEAGVDVDAFLGRKPRGIIDGLFALVRRPVLAAAAASALVTVLVVAVLYVQGWPHVVAPTEPVMAESGASELFTQIGEIREIALEDGSVVTLGPASRIQAEFSGRRRHLVLLEGEAFFDVVSDPERPFYVTSQDTLVRVVGTQFDVKRSADIVHVSVLEGVVEVLKPSDIVGVIETGDTASVPKQVLMAGERVSAARRVALPEIRQIEQAKPGAWRHGRLAYEDASLAEIIADMNRYSEQRINIATSEVGDLRSTISFDTEDMDEVLTVIAAIHPVTIERSRGGAVTLRRRDRR